LDDFGGIRMMFAEKKAAEEIAVRVLPNFNLLRLRCKILPM